jgi:hypothetical protein
MVVGVWSRRRLRREEGYEVGAEEEDGEAQEHELDAVHGDCARPSAPLPSWGDWWEERTRRKVIRRDDGRRKLGIFHPLGRVRETGALATWPRKACWCSQVHGRSNITTLSWPSQYCFLIFIFPT